MDRKLRSYWLLRKIHQRHEKEHAGKDVRVADAFGFKAGERISVEEAVAGDMVVYLMIRQVGATNGKLKFSGMPHFTGTV